MTQTRLILALAGVSILSGVVAGGLSKVLNFDTSATQVVVQFCMVILTIWLGGRLGWWDKVDTSGMSDESLPKILLHMLIGGAIIACGAVLALLFGDNMPGVLVATGIWGIGLFWMVAASARFVVWIIAARQNPALVDERMRFNRLKSEKWALLACFDTALILGLIDFNGWVHISGATVGFTVAAAGLFVGLASQYWLERRDG
jgi:hypothetical protein